MIKRLFTYLILKASALHRRYLSGIDALHIVAIGIGLMCGAGAALLKGGVDMVTNFIFSTFDIRAGNIEFFLLPICGIFIATAFARYITRQPMDHASDRMAADMDRGNGDISPRMILGPIIGCSITLGMGGSAGAEDPIAYTGGAIGSNIGKVLKMHPEDLVNLMGCGAAAGIAGIFMAPIGGVMFAMEVLKMKQSLKTVLAIVMASLTAALTCYILLGCHTDVSFVPEMRFDLHLVPYVILCGIFCGVYSAYYSCTMKWCRGRFGRISNVWLRALIGGLLLSAMLFVFPSLYGEGYTIIGKLMVDEPSSLVAYGPLYRLGSHIDWLLVMMAVILLIKPFATSATNDSGGVGGDFTPTFYCGGIAGFMFATVLNHFFGLDVPYALFAFFGMAAVMSGSVMAPLMAIFIAAEMTGLYGFILPLTIAALCSYVTTLVITGQKPGSRKQPPSGGSPTPDTSHQSVTVPSVPAGGSPTPDTSHQSVTVPSVPTAGSPTPDTSHQSVTVPAAGSPTPDTSHQSVTVPSGCAGGSPALPPNP